MEHYIFNGENGLWYELQGDYYLPCLIAQEEPKPVGIWGQRYLRHIKSNRRGFYTGLLLSGRLGSHLAEIDTKPRNISTDWPRSTQQLRASQRD